MHAATDAARAGPAELVGLRSLPALEIQEITDPVELGLLAPEWSRLVDADPGATPFQTPEWLLAWRESFLAEGLWCLAMRRAGRLVALAPLFIYRDPQSGMRQVTWLGNGISDRLDLIAAPHDRAVAAAALATHLGACADLWDVCDFRDAPAGSALLQAPIAAAGERLEAEEPCPALSLPRPPQPVTEVLPKSRRTDLRRCERRLSELGVLSLTRADAASLDEHFDALAHLHGARWSARGELGMLADEAVVAFHRRAAAALLERGALRLEALRLGDRIIATHYAFRLGERGYSYLHAFDPAFASFGAGWLLLARSLSAAAEEGVTTVDFLRGREAYKYQWGAKDQPQWRRRIWR